MSEEVAKQPKWVKPAAWILAGYMRLVFWTSRKTFVGPDHLVQFFRSGQPLILAAWHRHTLQSPFCYLAHRPKGRRLWAIASASKDGALAAMGLAGVGVDTVRGSSSKGGTAALRKMLKIIKDGEDLAFTPDGPRGPVYTVADGVLLAAKLSGAPIVPISYAARHRKLLGSWDRLIVPRPFTRLRFTYGEPVWIPREADEAQLGAYRIQLQAELMRIEALAESFDGAAM